MKITKSQLHQLRSEATVNPHCIGVSYIWLAQDFYLILPDVEETPSIVKKILSKLSGLKISKKSCKFRFHFPKDGKPNLVELYGLEKL